MPRLPLRGSPFLTAPLLFPGGLASAGEIGVSAGIADRVQQRLAVATSETPERGQGQADTRVDQAPASQLGGCRRVDVAGDRRLCPAPARTAAGHRSPAPLGETGSAVQAHAHPGSQRVQEPAHEDRLPGQCTETVSSRAWPGRRVRKTAARHDGGRVLATGEAYSRPAHYKKAPNPGRTEERQT
jgi:hypothetical protein